jgi:hypothetical protein
MDEVAEIVEGGMRGGGGWCTNTIVATDCIEMALEPVSTIQRYYVKDSGLSVIWDATIVSLACVAFYCDPFWGIDVSYLSIYIFPVESVAKKSRDSGYNHVMSPHVILT